MLDQFKRWYFRNNREITWFIIGFLVMDAIYQFGRGNYVSTVISLGIAYLNYIFYKR